MMTEQRKDQGGSPASPGKTTDANTVENQGYNQHGQARAASSARASRKTARSGTAATQPNFGQAGTYGKDPDAGSRD
jgi:hypothetical protein